MLWSMDFLLWGCLDRQAWGEICGRNLWLLYLRARGIALVWGYDLLTLAPERLFISLLLGSGKGLTSFLQFLLANKQFLLLLHNFSETRERGPTSAWTLVAACVGCSALFDSSLLIHWCWLPTISATAWLLLTLTLFTEDGGWPEVFIYSIHAPLQPLQLIMGPNCGLSRCVQDSSSIKRCIRFLRKRVISFR